jgi:DNA-directed RNA polymerase specialized sigma24 family protein
VNSAELVSRAKAGDPQAIAALHRAFWRAARATAYGVLGSFAEAEDAAAEVLSAALQACRGCAIPLCSAPGSVESQSGPPSDTPGAKRRRRSTSWGGQSPVEEELVRRERAFLLRLAVERLPSQLREAICLHYLEGYDVKEAARFLGIPVGSFKRPGGSLRPKAWPGLGRRLY